MPDKKKTMTYSKVDPSSFKMRSGNGPLAFKEMGASPAKEGGLIDWTGGFGKKNEITFPEDPNKPIIIDESKAEKIKPKKLDIINKDPKTGKNVKVGETNTSSRPEWNATSEQRMGSDYVTKMPEGEGKEITIKKPTDKETPEEPKKKTFWQKFQEHHDSGEARKVEAHFADWVQSLGGKGPTGNEIRNQIRQDELAAQKIKESQTRVESNIAKDADNEKFIINEVDTVATKDDGTPNNNATEYQLDVSKRRQEKNIPG